MVNRCISGAAHIPAIVSAVEDPCVEAVGVVSCADVAICRISCHTARAVVRASVVAEVRSAPRGCPDVRTHCASLVDHALRSRRTEKTGAWGRC